MSWFGGGAAAATNERDTFPVEASDGGAKNTDNKSAQEDYLAMVYGDFIVSDDPRLHYNRKVLGILTLQAVLNLGVNCLCARIGGLNDLSSNMLVFAASAFATIGSVVMLSINSENRT
jgi:hypothetical protein